MRGKMTIIQPDGKTTSRDMGKPLYRDLKEAVGGLLETVPYFDSFNGEPCVAFCNEEGKINRLPPNPAANRLWWDSQDTAGLRKRIDDVLVGPIVVLTGDEAFMEMV